MPKEIVAKDIMSKDFKTIGMEEKSTKAASMLESGSEVLMVTDDDGQYMGVITQKSLAQSRIKPNETKTNMIKTNAPVVSPDTLVSECARLILESGILDLPVIEDGKLIGVVDDASILSAALRSPVSKKKTGDIMTRKLFTVDPTEKISVVLDIMHTKQVSRVLVTEGGRLVGLVTLHDIISRSLLPKERQELGHIMAEKTSLHDLPVESVMMRDVVVGYEDDDVPSLVDKLIQDEIGSVAIVEGRGNAPQVIGIVTRKDILRQYVGDVPHPVLPDIRIVARGKERIDRKGLATILNDYTQKHPSLLGRSTFQVNVDDTEDTFRDYRYNEVRVNLLTPAGRFFASAEAIDEEQALKGALEKIDRQVERKLDLNNMFNPKSFDESLMA